MGAVQQRDAARWPEWMRPGIRVVRGPDMALTLNPKVELGTITYVPAKVGDNKVCVVWDSGRERTYRSGATGCYELRAYDIQQVGVQHPGVACSECGAKPLRGIRYHCPSIKTNLCTSCYMADKKDTQKTYYRIDTPKSEGVRLPLRSQAGNQKVKLHGIFENAKVVQGPHWSYAENTEGDATETGTVVSIIPVKDGVANGWVKVKWDIGGKVAEYRVGANGFVEVAAAEAVAKEQIYLEHLPVVGIIQFKPGDKVSVNMTVGEFKSVQVAALGDSGWIDAMNQCIVEDGTVLEVDQEGTLAQVQYQDGSVYTVTITALFRKASFYPKCVVTIMNDRKALGELQQGHGPNCPEVCGKLGRVVKVRRDGDMVVIVGSGRYTLSPTCCEPVDDPKLLAKAPKMPDEEEEDNNQYDKGSNFEASIRSLHSHLKRADQSLDSLAKEMYDALTAGDTKKLAAIINKNKQLVKYKMDDKTILHLVCYEGMKTILEQIIKLGGDINEKDNQGDSPLHYTAYSGKTECAQCLLKNKAAIDSHNKEGSTALMISIDDGNIDMVRLLVNNNASLVIKDNSGSTAMHEAVSQTEGQPVITAAVLGASSADFTIVNNSNCNVLHWAVLRNNIKAVEIMTNLKPDILKTTMPLGYTALHVAAANDFVEIAGIILQKKKLDVNVKDDNKMTPLHLAALQGHKRTIELLISEKSDVNAKDSEGNTPLHLAVTPNVPNMQLTISHQGPGSDKSIKITYYLLENGADLDIKNKQNKTALDLIDDEDIKKMIAAMASKYRKDPLKASDDVNCPMHWAKMDATEFTKVALDTTSKVEQKEYDDITKHFRLTVNYVTIDAIYRVQNPMVWKHYVLKKMEMEKRYGKGRANEKHLFHGTKATLIDIICKENFDFRIAGSNVGALLGKGSYFAKNAKYSDSYSQRDDDGFKYMFVVKVLVGKIFHGSKDLVRPPAVDAKDPSKGSYDTAVNNRNNPEVYCVYDKNQYYPEYIIKYHS